MLGIEELKTEIEITETTVECPVKDCNKKVERRRRKNGKDPKFSCPTHNISISPSTFKYTSEFDNLLWKSKQDRALLKDISEVKRVSKFEHDNSEDAVTWNIFRFLEINDLLADLLSKLTKSTLSKPEVIYWSYSQLEQNVWSKLLQARKKFETNPAKGSEPDIIIKSDKALFFIEAKLLASNNTPFRSNNPLVQKKYEIGGNNWYSKVFNSDFKTVALAKKKYELLRFWLLGTWIAEKLDLDFHLVNLVLSEREAEIGSIFKPHIKENQRRKFFRVTWETIYEYVSKNPSTETATLMRYFRNKTLGYDGNRRLQKAFSVI